MAPWEVVRLALATPLKAVAVATSSDLSVESAESAESARAGFEE